MLRKLEQKFGRFSIRGLMKYIMLLYLLGFVLFMISPGFYGEWLMLDVDKTFRKVQLWRLVTFLIQPIENVGTDTFALVDILFLLISMYLYYFIGNMLEMRWGSFRFNLFYLSGIVLNILSVVIVYFLTLGQYGTGISIVVPLEYMNTAMLMAFAVEFGEVQLLLFFAVPIKVKWLAVLYGVIYGWKIVEIMTSSPDIFMALVLVIPIVMAMLNFIIFYFATRKTRNQQSAILNRMRRAQYDKQYREGQAAGSKTTIVDGVGKVVSRHRCSVCGRTEIDSDELEFRFCSKCEGNFEYCSDHLYTHTHVIRTVVGADLNQTMQDEMKTEKGDVTEIDLDFTKKE